MYASKNNLCHPKITKRTIYKCTGTVAQTYIHIYTFKNNMQYRFCLVPVTFYAPTMHFMHLHDAPTVPRKDI
jgi:hypothetical protein